MEAMPPKRNEKVSCDVCSSWVLRRELYRHMTRVHNYAQEEIDEMKEERGRETSQVSCPICEEKFIDHETLASHCDDLHTYDGANGREQDYTVHTLTFATKDEFEKWLQEQCERTVSTLHQFASKGKTYKLRCNRAGKFLSKGRIRATSSRKDVSHCSCFVNYAVNDDGSVMMKGCFGHVGHDVEPALLRLSEAQKAYLKFLLEDHSLDYIIRHVRKEFPAGTSRLHFVTRSDLWNIIEQHGMRPGQRDSNDLTSLEMRVVEKNPDDGLKLFEMPEDPSGRGFTLVIVTPTQQEWLRQYSHRGISLDDTHGATRYNLKLATVIVLDERDRGLPAAFLLSGTMTAADVQKLFEEIKKLLPDFNPCQLVTDEAPCFIKGFFAVFPDSNTRPHYCRWHISRTWERKIRELVEARLRARVKKELNELLRIGELGPFERKFGGILALLDVEGQQQMAQYLRTNYLGRTTSWASFSNPGAVMNTTMLSERWHLRLKYEILRRNANSRVDSLVELLIRAVEDLAESNDIMDRRRLATASFRTQQTTARHRSALTHYEGKMEKIRRITMQKWEVQGKTPQVTYIVENRGSCECRSWTEGNVHCSFCGVCPYSWTCTCLDNRTGISCIHRHAVKLFEDNLNVPAVVHEQDEEEPASSAAKENVMPVSSDPFVSSQERLDERKSLRNRIQLSYSVVSSNVNVLVNKDTDEARDKLKEIADLIERASQICVGSSSQIAIRPRHTGEGSKPKQEKKLYTRAEYRRLRDADKDNDDQN